MRSAISRRVTSASDRWRAISHAASRISSRVASRRSACLLRIGWSTMIGGCHPGRRTSSPHDRRSRGLQQSETLGAQVGQHGSDNHAPSQARTRGPAQALVRSPDGASLGLSRGITEQGIAIGPQTRPLRGRARFPMARDRGSLRACVRETIVFSAKAGAVGLDRLGCTGTNVMPPAEPFACHSRAR